MNYNRKDALPYETINKIKSILNDLKIKVVEKGFKKVGNNIFSIRIELKEIPGLGTNGKGITKEYALASAYAELMERLQSLFLLKSDFLNKEKTKFFKDEVKLSIYEFEKIFPELKEQKAIFKMLEKNDNYRVCTEFENLIDDERKLLPIKLINFLTHSNGLCSGNSKEEALAQGFCEIFERFCYKEILFKENNVPTVEVENIKNFWVYEQLKEIENLGFTFEIKDCSLSGKFPVVGLMIFDNKKENYIFTMGADFDFNIAVQRCITEAFQGLNHKDIELKLKPIKNFYMDKKNEIGEEFLNYNWLKCYSSNNGIHHPGFFCSTEKVSIKKLPFKEIKSNKEALACTVELLKKENLNAYIKDYSYLGFDTYKIYIPKLSEIENVTELSLNIRTNYQKLKDAYFNLGNVKEPILEFEEIFETLNSNIKYSKLIKPSNLMGVNSYVEADYFKLNYLYILIIYYSLIGVENKIQRLISNKLLDVELSEYEKLFLRSILNAIDKEEVNEKFKDEVNMLIYKPKKILKKLDSPTCPNCICCKCRSKCKYKSWNRIIKMLINKHSKVDKIN